MAANAAEEVAARLRVIRDQAATKAPLATVQALGQAGETATKLTLTKRTHKKGLGIRTNSPPGAPPALVTGMLRRSVHRSPARVMGAGMAVQVMGQIGPARIYGPVHEYGPVTITAKNFPQLGNPEVGFFGPQVEIPRRPWMKPSMEALISSGLGTKACMTAWAASVYA